MYKENNLSKNQQIIFDLINKSSEPLKAYTILFNVQKRGIKAPPQVYRALDKLVQTGKIHKIESKAKLHMWIIHTSIHNLANDFK